MDGMAALIWCPFPDRETARRVSADLLDDNVIACANILGEIESIFEWNGKRGTGHEVAVLFKTSAAAIDRAIARLGELHPYDTPAVIGWTCDQSHPATLDWLIQQTNRE